MIPEESHPLDPFLPCSAKVLLLGSFPPQKKRWCMDFFYPNPNNDMWRVMGLIFFQDKNHFIDPATLKFQKEAIEAFLIEKGIALYDTATKVRRLKENASDEFLEITEETDIDALLGRIPSCHHVAATGQKSFSVLTRRYNLARTAIGGQQEGISGTRHVCFHRMPSTSRAYPMKLEQKAAYYQELLKAAGIIP